LAAETVRLPRTITRRLRREAEKQGLSLEEYLVELVSQNLDPSERAREYIEASRELLEQAREELGKGDVRQAAEKLWGAAALAVKAYAAWKDGRRLSSHGELWEYMRKMIGEIGRWVRDAWAYANMMHTCFYEGWCSREDAEEAEKRIGRLVEEVAERIRSQSA
jgi:HEPN domain-containing protein